MNDDLNGLDSNESEENLDLNSDFETEDETDLVDVNGASTHVGG